MTPHALLSAKAVLLVGGVSLFLCSTMAVYAGRCATIGPLPEGPGSRGPAVFPAWVRSWWRWLCSPVVRVCLRLGIPAEAVALLGVGASTFSVVAILAGSLGGAGWMYLAAATLAAIGTQLARSEGRPARAAALLDGTLGRLAELMVLGAIAYAVRAEGGALVAALCAMGATMLASDARLRSDALGATLPTRGDWFGRSERALLVGSACALVPAAEVMFHAGAGVDLLAASLALVAALAVVSAVRRIHTAHETLRTIDALAANPGEATRLRVVRGGRV